MNPTELAVCRRCELRVQADTPIPPAGDSSRAKLAIVLRRATREDLVYGEASSDPAGRLLRAVLTDAGWPPASVYFTTVVKCPPAEGVAPAKVKCPAGCRQTCAKGWLLAELQDLPYGSPICLMGQGVASEVLGFCGAAVRNRPLYVCDAEASLLVGGKIAYAHAVEFFKGLRDDHATRSTV